MLCQIISQSIIKFCEYNLLLISDTSSMNVDFYSLSNSFYFIILCYIEQKIYLQFQDLNAQKSPASRGLWPFKSQYFKG